MTPAADDPDARWFRRFRLPPDRAEAAHEQVEVSRRAIEGAEDPADLLAHLLELAWALTPLGQEVEAAVHGRRAADLARAQGDAGSEIEALLHTATALQYGGRPAEAADLFGAAIQRAQEAGETGQLHYLQHHLGRLVAERFDEAAARTHLEAALSQRRQLGDQNLIRSSQAALDDLATWIADRCPPEGP